MTHKQRSWLVMFAAFLAGVAIAVNQFKVPPVMPVLMQQLRLDATTGGFLMSSFAIAGIILGIPAALVLVRLGPKTAGLIALGCTIAGSLIGATAQVAAQLVLGRMIEGVGLGLIAVVSPAVVSMWFAPHERGTPMGIWSAWVPVGGFLILNLSGPLLQTFGWQGGWWFGALFALVAFVIYAAVVRAPGELHGSSDARRRTADVELRKMLWHPASWILALVFMMFNLAAIGWGTWAPSYFNEGLQIPLGTANFYASLSNLTAIPMVIIAGQVLDRVRNRVLVMAIAIIAQAVAFIWSFQLGDANLVALYMLLLGCIGSWIPVATFTLAPETMPRPELAGLALGIVSVGQNIGMLIGPPIVGASIANGNWGAGILPLVVPLIAGLLFALLLYRRHPQAQPSVAS